MAGSEVQDANLGKTNYEAWIGWLAEFHEELTEDFPSTLPWCSLSVYVQCAFQAGAEAVAEKVQ